MSFVDVAQLLLRNDDVHFWYLFADSLCQPNVQTMLESHPLYAEINHDNLAELLLPYMKAFLQNDRFFWEFEYSLDATRTIFYQGLCYWMYEHCVKKDGFMLNVIQFVVDEGMGEHFLHDLDPRHTRMLEANVDRFTAHEALIANEQTLHAQAFYLSNVHKQPSVHNDTQKNTEIKDMLVGHWDEEETYKREEIAASLAATTKGLATPLPKILSPAVAGVLKSAKKEIETALDTVDGAINLVGATHVSQKDVDDLGIDALKVASDA